MGGGGNHKGDTSISAEGRTWEGEAAQVIDAPQVARVLHEVLDRGAPGATTPAGAVRASHAFHTKKRCCRFNTTPPY